jgi:hypothetical protein
MLKAASFSLLALAACSTAPAVSLALLAAGAGALLADRRC